MVLRRFLFVTAAFSAIICAATDGRAQFSAYELAAMSGGASPQNTISATGTAVIKRLPTTVRAIVPLSVKGKSMEEAMAKLKTERENALAKVQKLKADKKDVKFSSPSAASAQTSRQRQMEMMIAQRMNQNKKKAAQVESVTLACTMTVEWPLTGKTAEDILLETSALKQKIKAAELTGKKEAEKLTPEEEEQAAELAEMARNQGEDPEAANEPQFLFVAKIGAEEREKAFADAFAQAQKNGAMLAKAAGIELGALAGISGQGRGTQSYSDEYSPYSSYSQRQMRMQQLGEDSEQQITESVASDPDMVSFSFGVNAIFKMGK